MMKIISNIKCVARMLNKSLSLLFICLLSASASAANNHTVDNTNSRVTFSGEHVGMTFSGIFEKWEASLVLPPAAKPLIEATFYLTSAKTGDFTYDSTLSEGDWFNTEDHPTGHFTSQSVEASDNGYRVTGNLELRGVSKTQTFELKRSGDTLTADFIINRLDYSIGFDSDPDAEWVSRDIVMSLQLKI